jgi:hypothetical protein
VDRGNIFATNHRPWWITGAFNFIQADYEQAGGDSGAPGCRNDVAWGFHSGGTATWGTFARAEAVENCLNIRIMV